MKVLVGWPVRHPAAALLILVALFAVGLTFAPWLPSQRLAPMADVWIRVEVELPGIDAAQIDSLVTRPLEGRLISLAGLQQVVSRSSEGFSEIRLQFVTKAVREAALEEARARASAASLPSGTQKPLVERDQPVLAPAVVYAITGVLSADTMQWAENSLRRALQELPEISTVTLVGAEQVEILVQPDLRRMATLGLSFDDLIQALRGREEAPHRGTRRLTVAGSASVQAIAARAVHLESGEPVSLAEIAHVSLLHRPAMSRPLHQGEPALLMHVYPRSAVDASLAAERAGAHLGWLRANGLMPTDVRAQILSDESVRTRQWRRQLLRRIGFCVLATLAIVSVFLGLRRGMVALALLTVWLPLAAAFLWVVGLTFNIMTALGVMLALIPLTLALTFLPFWKTFSAMALAVAGLLGIASIWSPFLWQVGVAFLVAASAGGMVCWLLTPWLASRTTLLAAFARLSSSHATTAVGVSVVLPLVIAIAVAAMAPTSVPPPLSANVTDTALVVRLWGDDLQQVTGAADRLATYLRAFPGLSQVSSSAESREHWRLQLDMQSLERFGITLAEVGRAFAVARGGLVIGDGLDGDKRLPLRLQLMPDVAGAAFERLLLRGEQSQRPAIYLRDVGVTLRVNAPSERLHIQRMPAAEVNARVLSSEVPRQPDALREVISLPSGYSFEWNADRFGRVR